MTRIISPPQRDIPSMRAYRKWHTTGEILPLHWSVDGKLVLQILFDRGISDRHVDQCSPEGA